MKGLKFLFKRGFCHIVLNIISIVFMLGMMVAVALAHEPVGVEDYIMCKIGAHLGVMLSVMLNLMFLCADVTGNRLMRSAPFSKQLKRFSIPTYCVILGGGGTVLVNAAYAIFCIVSGLDMNNLCDMLIVSAPLMLCYIIMGTIALNINYGMILGVYIIFPVMGLFFAIPLEVWEFGFGLPLWAGALIFVGTLAVSITGAFTIGRIFHEKVDFKPIQQNATYVK
ncbi:MAG: hypothetical protein E7485_08035 [Ruminococcaceae bacterium]|nr:hypothetical protein [Oscillospiraceae bacterium]